MISRHVIGAIDALARKLALGNICDLAVGGGYHDTRCPLGVAFRIAEKGADGDREEDQWKPEDSESDESQNQAERQDSEGELGAFRCEADHTSEIGHRAGTSILYLYYKAFR